MRRRVPLAVLLLAILLASCGARPGVTVTIAGQKQPVPMVLTSTTERTGCSGSHADMAVRDVPVTTVREGPVTVRFEAGTGATSIRGWIHEEPSVSPGGPIEEFTLSGSSGTYEPTKLVAGRTYQFTVNVQWSFVVTNGEETHGFRLRIEPP